jgi:tetratricopeptide (TPR) repeat protein
MTSRRVFRVFISGVTNEVGDARSRIAGDLRKRGLMVKVQEDFRQEAGIETTLATLEAYIRECDAVVHIAGRRSGAFPDEDEARPFQAMLPDGVMRASYTQWEFHFARHHKRRVSRYVAKADYVPDRADAPLDDDPASQAAHVVLIEKFNRKHFSGSDELRILVLQEDWHIAQRQPRNLPFASLRDMFKGREAELAALHRALDDIPAKSLKAQALHGLGGVGKTRLAVEYAHRHADEHSALIFLSAETPERLESGLSALSGPEMFDLPEKEAKEDTVKIPAALGWLDRHPGWLMILDNVDDEASLKAVQALLARLSGGKVIITGRLSAYPAGVKKLELGVLDPDAAAAFLLERTEGGRVAAADDTQQARRLADELGGLALGLEQAGAYIAAERIGFARYLALWRESREKIVGWFDRELMSYAHDAGLAATWATSIAKLTSDARSLLERLAFLAPEPIPDSLLDIAVGDEELDAYAARGRLFAYSLISRAGSAGEPAFSVHRLVQDFTRRGMSADRRRAALEIALLWVDEAFTGHPADVRSWKVLDPLLPHALVLAALGDAEGLPTSSYLMARLGSLLDAKANYPEAERLKRRALLVGQQTLQADDPEVAARANNLAALLTRISRYDEAESLYRRALSINEAHHGSGHPEVATDLNNLGHLLHLTGRTEEAETLFRRALAIDEISLGADHPNVAVDLNNLGSALRRMKRFEEAEALLRRALAIDEEKLGPGHPHVAIRLGNIGRVLSDLNRRAEAEPFFHRALAIDEASYGPDHPHVGRRLNNLAGHFQVTDRAAEAEPLYRRALAIMETSHGPDHPDTQSVRENLAALTDGKKRDPAILRA